MEAADATCRESACAVRRGSAGPAGGGGRREGAGRSADPAGSARRDRDLLRTLWPGSRGTWDPPPPRAKGRCAERAAPSPERRGDPRAFATFRPDEVSSASSSSGAGPGGAEPAPQPLFSGTIAPGPLPAGPQTPPPRPAPRGSRLLLPARRLSLVPPTSLRATEGSGLGRGEARAQPVGASAAPQSQPQTALARTDARAEVRTFGGVPRTPWRPALPRDQATWSSRARIASRTAAGRLGRSAGPGDGALQPQGPGVPSWGVGVWGRDTEGRWRGRQASPCFLRPAPDLTLYLS